MSKPNHRKCPRCGSYKTHSLGEMAQYPNIDKSEVSNEERFRRYIRAKFRQCDACEMIYDFEP